ncbi:MAG: HAD family phosphatase [Tabrizicola sp.]|nr:HAD family phosphatase [Tabrizicola sp.]
MYDAVFFDLDGTLVDTESLSIDAGVQAFAEHGHEIGRDFFEGMIGIDNAASDAAIRAAFPAINLDAVTLRFGAIYHELIADGPPLKPGVTTLLPQLRQPMAVVTSSGRDSARRKLSLAGIAPHFAHVVTRDDVVIAKPDPEPYLLAARLHGVSPERCLVFEDSETGAEAAHRAGCKVVQVPDILPSQGRWAHYLAPDLITGARLSGLI